MNDMNISSPSALFFDWDGTLVDSYAVLENAHNHTRQSLGFEALAPGEFTHYFGKPRDILYNILYPGKEAEGRAGFEAYYKEHHLNGIRILPGIPQLLAFAAEEGIPCGVVTNKKAAFIHEEITHLGWDLYFSSVIGAGDAIADKPSPAPLLLAIEKAEVPGPKSSIWMLGDTENDLLCASRAGCKSVLIIGKEAQDDVLKQAPADLVFDNCRIFQEFLLHSLKKEIKGNNI
ncbi:MAG: HAD family hydrolase [Alphaproteobacteria bacterium]|nr:HAD family hydrolase [Alphaproteobacteria bacterium]